MKTPKPNWKKFMAEFKDLAHEMDISLKNLRYSENGVSFELIAEDCVPVNRIRTKIIYYTTIGNHILYEVIDQIGVREIVSSPHGAFAVCFI